MKSLFLSLFLFSTVGYSQDTLLIDEFAANNFSDSLTGTIFPNLELIDLDGVTHNVADCRGKVTPT